MPRKLKSGPGSRPGPRYQTFDEQRESDRLEANRRRTRSSRKSMFSGDAKAYLLTVVIGQSEEEKKKFITGCEMIAEVAEINYWKLDHAPLPAQDLIATSEDFARSVKEFAQKFDGLPHNICIELDLAAHQWLKETGGGDPGAFLRRLQSDLFTLESIAAMAARQVTRNLGGGSKTKPLKLAVRIAAANLRELFNRHGLNFSVVETGNAAKCLRLILEASLPSVPTNLTHYLSKVQ